MLHQPLGQLDEVFKKRTFPLLLSLLLLHIVLHFKYLDLPPVGFHQWRQTQTLSVARNFYEESMNILKPRVDSRGDQTGITGMEFPIVNYLIAVGYHAFGYSYTVQRVVILLFSLSAIIGCFYFTSMLLDSSRLGLTGAAFLAFSPLFSYYSIVVMPEIPSLALMYFGLYCLVKWNRNPRLSTFVLSIAFLCIAALIKVSALLVLPIWLWQVFKKRELFASGSRVHYSVLLALMFLVVFAWYGYARYLSDVHLNYDFKLNIEFPYSFTIVPHVANRVFIQWLPELYVNYAQFVFLVLGLVAAKQLKDKNLNSLLLLYAVGVAFFMIAMFPMFEMHDYYMIPALPLLILLATLGVRKVWTWSIAKPMRFRLVMFLLFLVPVLGSIRALSRFEGATVDHELISMENHLNNVLPSRDTKVIAAGDASPSIYLYFIHRKGWAVAGDVTVSYIEEIARQGAQFIVSDNRELEERLKMEIRIDSVDSHGRFNVYRLNK